MISEKDITICGHGSNTPSLKCMQTYLTQRYSQKMSNGHRKGLIRVRRFKKLNALGRLRFHDTYSTILGRNLYNQSRRSYCYKKYKDGKYYSDCSSSCCLTLAQIGCECPDYNTEGILTSDRFEDVPVKIENGHVKNPEVLQVGDFLLFAGNVSHYEEVGHVEAVYSIGGTSYAEQVRSFQRWLNKYYISILEAAEVGKISVDGQYGAETRAAALAVWKYMANKYYGANLTLNNHYFYESSKKAAAKMTDAEVAKHPTLEEIRDGICHGRGYKDINSFKSAKKVSDSADIWHALFN